MRDVTLCTLAACRCNAEERREGDSTSLRCHIGVSATQGATSVRFSVSLYNLRYPHVGYNKSPDHKAEIYSAVSALSDLGRDTGNNAGGNIRYVNGRSCVCPLSASQPG